MSSTDRAAGAALLIVPKRIYSDDGFHLSTLSRVPTGDSHTSVRDGWMRSAAAAHQRRGQVLRRASCGRWRPAAGVHGRHQKARLEELVRTRRWITIARALTVVPSTLHSRSS